MLTVSPTHLLPCNICFKVQNLSSIWLQYLTHGQKTISGSVPGKKIPSGDFGQHPLVENIALLANEQLETCFETGVAL